VHHRDHRRRAAVRRDAPDDARSQAHAAAESADLARRERAEQAGGAERLDAARGELAARVDFLRRGPDHLAHDVLENGEGLLGLAAHVAHSGAEQPAQA
jgi:hypothetical protein